MRIWIGSDLHLEFEWPAATLASNGWPIPLPPGMPVMFVAGNHEFFGASMVESIKAGDILFMLCIPGFASSDKVT